MPTEWESAFAGKRVLVIGDLMLDEFIWGKVSRISPEAPVPVVNVTGESYYPGGAANVARNVREFTPNTAVIGLAGSDSQGQRLIHLLEEAGIDTSGVQVSDGFPTIVKTRVIARNQQVVRIDRERTGSVAADETVRHIERVIASYDAIIVADYGKGFLTQPLADSITAAARAHRKILTVDPHPHTSLCWQGVTAIKPNRAEAFIAAGLPPSDSGDALLKAATRLLERWKTENLLIT
jgi:rfaE bifunctional protein kinase chain/domain